MSFKSLHSPLRRVTVVITGIGSEDDGLDQNDGVPLGAAQLVVVVVRPRGWEGRGRVGLPRMGQPWERERHSFGCALGRGDAV